MEGLRRYLFSIIVSAFLCGVISQIMPDGKRKAQMRLITGCFLAVSVLSPLSDIDLDVFAQMSMLDRSLAEYYVAQGTAFASEEKETFIRTACEAYIENKAEAFDAVIAAQITLNEEQLPIFAAIQGRGAIDAQTELQRILTVELGIPKENQRWTWKQEGNTS